MYKRQTETLPESIIGLAKNQPYTIDTTYTSETVVETTDAYGNVNGRYTFSGWTDPNNGFMGESNVTVTGTWTCLLYTSRSYPAGQL